MQKQEIRQEEQTVPTPGELGADGDMVRFADLTLLVLNDPQPIEVEWRRLERLTKNSLHQRFDWCLAWTHARKSELVIIQGVAHNRTHLILPLEIVTDKGFRVARFPGDRFNNLNSGLFDADLAEPDAEELQNFVHATRTALKDTADIIVLDNIPLAWRGARHPLLGLATNENHNRSFQLPLFPNFEATIAQLNAKSRRKKFRSSSRKLEAIGGYDYICPESRAEKHALLDLFFHQKSERLAQFRLPDVFQPDDIRQFFHRLLDVPAEGFDTPLSLFAIRLRGEHAGHIAAIAGLSRKGDHIICQFSSIDESICPEASPGELLFWLTIEQSCRQGAAIFDFGVGDQPYKRNWCTQQTVQHDILLPLTWKGSLLRPLMMGATKAKVAIKRNPHLYSLVQRWRAGHCPKDRAAPGSEAE